MGRRWARWIGLGLLVVVLLAFGTWRLLREIPGLLANAEDTIRREAEALGFRVSFRDVRFHPLHLRLSLEDLNIRDGFADIPLAHAGHVELSLSPRRILSGLSPVSRVLVRTFSVQAGEANRTLLEKLRASGKEGGRDALPEVFLLDGDVRIGPMGPLERWEAKVPEVRIRPVRFLGTRVSVGVRRAGGRVCPPRRGGGAWLLPAATAGGVSFFAQVEGPLESPEGSGKILARNLLVPGNTPAEAEGSLAVSGKKIRLESFRGNLWAGAGHGAGV